MNDLVFSAGSRISLALAGGLGLILVAERHHLRELTGRVLFLRWRTWVFSAPLFGAAALGPRALAVAFVALLSVQGAREYCKMAGLTSPYAAVLVFASAVSAPVALWAPLLWLALPGVVMIALSAVPVVRGDARGGAEHLSRATFGFVYVPYLLGYFLLIRELPAGGRMLLAIGTAVAVSDVCAFGAGRLFGKRLLAPEISPAKTVAGAIGNVAGAYLGFALMAFIVPAEPLVIYSLPAVIGVAAIWGDLVESSLKRHHGVKDAGSWLPGFGGLLDRIDSLLFVLPASYAYLLLAT